MTYAEKLKFCRAAAKKLGLTFKKQNCTINAVQAYKFCNRSSGFTLVANCTLNRAIELIESGELI